MHMAVHTDDVKRAMKRPCMHLHEADCMSAMPLRILMHESNEARAITICCSSRRDNLFLSAFTGLDLARASCLCLPVLPACLRTV